MKSTTHIPAPLTAVSTYSTNQALCVIGKVSGEFGGLSNFAPMPIRVKADEDTYVFPTSEALYQAFKFSDPVIQTEIMNAASPFLAKKMARSMGDHVRTDWNRVSKQVMLFCLSVKYQQYQNVLDPVLEKTVDCEIVEVSKSDDFWGAVPSLNGKYYTGNNLLGKCWAAVRDAYFTKNHKFSLLMVSPHPKTNLTLMGSLVGAQRL